MTRDHHPSVCGASRISESCPTTVSGASGIQRWSSAFTSLLDSIQRPPRSTASWCVPPYLARMHRFNSGKSGPSARKLPGSPEGSPVDAGNLVTKFRRLGNDSPPKDSYRFVRRAEERERLDAGRHESRPRSLRASRRETRAARRTFARLAAAAVRGCGVSAPESVVRPSGATWSIFAPWLGGGGLSTPGNGGDDSLSATARRGGESAKLIS